MNNLLTTALKYLNTTEGKGAINNPTIMGWAKTLGIYYGGDATPWCALFVSWVAYEASAKGLRTLTARKWLTVGTTLNGPEVGCVAILWRDSINSGKGHVGIVSSFTDTHITLLGGNQNQTVSYATFPKTRVLGYRRLEGAGTPAPKPKSKIGWIVLGVTAFVGLTGAGLWLAFGEEDKKLAF